LHLGGRRFDRLGFYMEPTVFDDVDPRLALAREEIFGPVLTVMLFNTQDEAISIAPSVSYGLSARIWSCDVASGYALARQLRVGEVTVNPAPPYGVGPAASAEPFGQSGFGVEGGLEGLRQYTRWKAIHSLPTARAE
jgi:aldehyde dehydrogenase (NAD+)